MQIKTTMRYHLIAIRMAIIKEFTNKWRRRYGDKETLLHCWWQSRLVQPLWKTVSVQFSHLLVSNSLPPMDCYTPGFPVHHQLPELAQTHVHWVNDAIQPSQPLSSPFPPALIFPSIRVFTSESVLQIRWPKCWSFSFSISPSNESSWLISFGLMGLILLQSKGLSRDFSWEAHTSQRISVLKNTPFPPPPQVSLGTLKFENHYCCLLLQSWHSTANPKGCSQVEGMSRTNRKKTQSLWPSSGEW